MQDDQTPETTAYRGAPEALGPSPAVVLVEPQMGENIGAAARAMLNFGLTNLRIVNPRDGWPNERAVAMASGALAVVERAEVSQTAAEALQDCHYVLATTARPREMLLPVFDPAAAAKAFRERMAAGQKCAVLFGAERRGLLNDDILKADGIISIPVNPAFASLNLAQAVNIVAYEWARAEGREGWAGDLQAVSPASKADFEGLIGHLFGELEQTSYFFPPERRPHKERNLKAALQRAGLTEGEVRSLRGVVKALSQKRRQDELK